ncbi:MAG: hypothetical protein IJ344_01730, partial [Clostridia bacterium]|nr:hypothetical protein [Clostridia bacterium]
MKRLTAKFWALTALILAFSLLCSCSNVKPSVNTQPESDGKSTVPSLQPSTPEFGEGTLKNSSSSAVSPSTNEPSLSVSAPDEPST